VPERAWLLLGWLLGWLLGCCWFSLFFSSPQSQLCLGPLAPRQQSSQLAIIIPVNVSSMLLCRILLCICGKQGLERCADLLVIFKKLIPLLTDRAYRIEQNFVRVTISILHSLRAHVRVWNRSLQGFIQEPRDAVLMLLNQPLVVIQNLGMLLNNRFQLRFVLCERHQKVFENWNFDFFTAANAQKGRIFIIQEK
jgi:hypothetical protein